MVTDFALVIVDYRSLWPPVCVGIKLIVRVFTLISLVYRNGPIDRLQTLENTSIKSHNINANCV